MTKERTHRCKRNPHRRDVEIRFEQINAEEWHWVCVQLEFGSQDVDGNARAATSGTAIAFHTILINFCPFCGKALA